MKPKGDILTDVEDTCKSFAFMCPGCNFPHSLFVERPVGQQPLWTWNGSMTSPTFTPSLLVKSNRYNKELDIMEPTLCHSFITDGKIQFLSDCNHSLAETTVDLPDFEGW